ncbi:hypothetical protein GJ697_08000 [Pseudoduganella sp. FT25W]|uniref:DUF1640 domain-containing protein n=1 Tax=Duganella alba TaxID=2666081 RepID=A0A6L5QDR5_9BURK|nr:hypothetical protein [Duganella alba]MRX07770.1 hypothetical protein [Duganella alba]MRX15373.1 hypothetical protein [Duganella alba]
MMATNSDNTALEDLTLTVKIIESNYATKEDLAVLNGKIDALTTRIDGMPAQFELAMRLAMDEAFQRHTEMLYKVFTTKEELANAIYQQTWRMAAFGGLLLSAGFAFARYL